MSNYEFHADLLEHVRPPLDMYFESDVDQALRDEKHNVRTETTATIVECAQKCLFGTGI